VRNRFLNHHEINIILQGRIVLGKKIMTTPDKEQNNVLRKCNEEGTLLKSSQNSNDELTIRMPKLRDKSHFRWSVWIFLRKVQMCFEQASFAENMKHININFNDKVHHVDNSKNN